MILSSLFMVLVYLAIQMTFIWVLYLYLKNPSIVDVAWGAGLVVSGFIYLTPHQPSLRITLIQILLAIWGTRLALYLLLTRIIKGHQDKRYTQLSDKWSMSKSLGFFINFQLQGAFIFILSIIFLFAGNKSPGYLLPLDYIGFALAIVGIIGETLADYQLTHFKKNWPGMVCNTGLWSRSRHPNYFFDWLTWCGFTLFALHQPLGCLAIISPIFLYFIFTKITGPMTERGSIESKGRLYLNYIENTPMFFLKIN